MPKDKVELSEASLNRTPENGRDEQTWADRGLVLRVRWETRGLTEGRWGRTWHFYGKGRNGKTIKKALGRAEPGSYAAARKRADELRMPNTAERLAAVEAPEHVDDRLTIAAAFAKWQADPLAMHGRKEAQRKARLSRFVRLIVPEIGDKVMRLQRAADIDRWLVLRHDKTRLFVDLRLDLIALWDHAMYAGWLPDGPNPARSTGKVKPQKATPHPAVAWREAPGIFAKVPADTMGGPAMRFAVLTAVRTVEAALADWSEIDVDAALWVIPAERMKGKREHRVPLSSEALALIGTPGKGRVFPGATPRELLRAMRKADDTATAHGWRSTFRVWASEATTHGYEVIENSIAHLVGGDTERRYMRSDLLDRRRALMQEWADYLTA